MGAIDFEQTRQVINSRNNDERVEYRYGVSSVGTISTSIPHGLGRPPKSVLATAKGNATIFEASSPDSTNIYLQASLPVSVYWEVK